MRILFKKKKYDKKKKNGIIINNLCLISCCFIFIIIVIILLGQSINSFLPPSIHPSIHSFNKNLTWINSSRMMTNVCLYLYVSVYLKPEPNQNKVRVLNVCVCGYWTEMNDLFGSSSINFFNVFFLIYFLYMYACDHHHHHSCPIISSITIFHLSSVSKLICCCCFQCKHIYKHMHTYWVSINVRFSSLG